MLMRRTLPFLLTLLLCLGAAGCTGAPQDSNANAPADNSGENQLLFAANKWLIGHSESGVDKDGGFIGLIGENTQL